MLLPEWHTSVINTIKCARSRLHRGANDLLHAQISSHPSRSHHDVRFRSDCEGIDLSWCEHLTHSPK
jgi:hypothetical protein